MQSSKTPQLGQPVVLSFRTGNSQTEHVVASPEPIFTVPYPRDLDYIRRKSLIDQIHEKLSVPAAWVALVGLGGVG